MNHKKRVILVILTIILFLVLTVSCTLVTPDYDSYTVSYIKVSPSLATITMQVNTSKLLKVKAYDSEGELIPIDPSEVTWEASYECWACGVTWNLNPKTGSASTYFTPEKIGRYYVYAHYKEKTTYSRIDAE
jgi:hypothetical protein